MPRYIDADELKSTLKNLPQCGGEVLLLAVLNTVDRQFTARVEPVEMVDKAKHMGYERGKREVAAEIFAEIEKVLNQEYTELEQRRGRSKDPDAIDSMGGELCGLDYAIWLVTELKEKYIGGD